MPTRYTVQAGDCIDSIALAHGLFPATVWDDPDNAALKEKRKDQNVLMPGDVVVIPDKRVKEVKAATDKVHTFRRKGVPKLFRVQMKLPSGAPYKNAAYELSIDGAKPVQGTTNGEGWLEHYISPRAKQAKLTIKGTTFTLDLGKLDPVSETSGVKGRLCALGFYTGEVDNTYDEATADAVRAFQVMNGMNPTGEVDDDLRKALVKEMGA